MIYGCFLCLNVRSEQNIGSDSDKMQDSVAILCKTSKHHTAYCMFQNLLQCCKKHTACERCYLKKRQLCHSLKLPQTHTVWLLATKCSTRFPHKHIPSKYIIHNLVEKLGTVHMNNVWSDRRKNTHKSHIHMTEAPWTPSTWDRCKLSTNRNETIKSLTTESHIMSSLVETIGYSTVIHKNVSLI